MKINYLRQIVNLFGKKEPPVKVSSDRKKEDQLKFQLRLVKIGEKYLYFRVPK